MSEELPTARPAELARRPPEARWLIRDLWGRAAAGVLGGAPKSAKSWMGLEMAVAVASATPCLGRFPVEDPGPALVYLAEDGLPLVRERLEALAAHRDLALEDLDLHVITAPALRLDLAPDRERLARTLERLQPRLLVLDPLVRLHRLNENDAGEISGLLGDLRALSRTHELALVLVHHASKKARRHLGEALRGSGDLYAFGDCYAYLQRTPKALRLSLEHRAAPAPDPLELTLASRPDGTATHLEIVEERPEDGAPTSLEDRVRHLLADHDQPLSRTALRDRLRVNNNRLGDTLHALEQRGVLARTPEGWALPGRDAL